MEATTFETVVDDLNNGQALQDLSEALTEVVKAVRTAGKVGEIIYKIKVKPASKGEVRTILIEDSIQLKTPHADRPASIFFVSKDNRLMRNDPNQTELPLKVVEMEEGPIRKVVNA